MVIPLRSARGLGSAAILALLAACAPDSATAPKVSRATSPTFAQIAASGLPSGERILGQVAIEPAYEDVSGSLIFLATPIKSPFPTHTNSHAVAPLYLVEYPPGTTVGTTMNCMGVPGNCPDHDLDVATVATTMKPAVYGTNPAAVPGHNHLVAGPGSGGDFNVAWNVVEILFTNKAAANTLLTTEKAVEDAIDRGDAIEVDLGFAFHCSVVSSAAYYRGTPLG